MGRSQGYKTALGALLLYADSVRGLPVPQFTIILHPLKQNETFPLLS